LNGAWPLSFIALKSFALVCVQTCYIKKPNFDPGNFAFSHNAAIAVLMAALL
jgi:hypothetical protein